jgi:hypothetical protein
MNWTILRIFARIVVSLVGLMFVFGITLLLFAFTGRAPSEIYIYYHVFIENAAIKIIDQEHINPPSSCHFLNRRGNDGRRKSLSMENTEVMNEVNECYSISVLTLSPDYSLGRRTGAAGAT